MLNASGKRICVIGDPMLDEWVPVAPSGNGTESPVFRVVGPTVVTPGGAANAARQLARWGCDVILLGPSDGYPRPVKRRYLDPQGRLVLRADTEDANYGMTKGALAQMRDRVLRSLKQGEWDAVYLADYAKGVFDRQLFRAVIESCRDRDIPCVADPRGDPELVRGAVLKCNDHYAARWPGVLSHSPSAVVTYGAHAPAVFWEDGLDEGKDDLPPVLCKNHVGAGDCFGAHLTLALAWGQNLPWAARFAHAAGRMFVQRDHGEPPWPHEVYRELDPVMGKRLDALYMAPLRESLKGRRVVWSNGVFRLPHAGHAWLLRWAKARGDVLVVGVNDDASAAREKPGKHCRPLPERLEFLAGLSCVDWIVPFPEPEPTDLVGTLMPDVLVKGHEYRDTMPPGSEFAQTIAFAPESPFPLHATDLVEALRT